MTFDDVYPSTLIDKNIQKPLAEAVNVRANILF